MRVKPAVYNERDWVYYFCPRHRVGKLPKWHRFYSGPFLVIQKLGVVNIRIQRSPRANPMVVHVDKIKHCMGTTPASWLGIDDYRVIPAALEPDALPFLFEGVDRSVTRRCRPKHRYEAEAQYRYTGAIFITNIYAVPNNISLSRVTGELHNDCVNNSVMCLCLISDMKKTGYVCFPCWK